MRFSPIGSVVALLLSASALAAQQPQTPGPGGHGQQSDQGSMSMMMDSLDHRLDSLVDRMNRSTGNQKVQSMAAVMNELVSQRKMMRDRMHGMMEQGGMMGSMKDQAKSPRSKPQTQPEATGTDSTDHAAHHPPQ